MKRQYTYLCTLVLCFLTVSFAKADIAGVKQIQVRSASGTGSEIIQLTEVIAYRAHDNVDVAHSQRNATAQATSTYRDLTASLGVQFAIDGNANTNPQAGYYHSELDPNQVTTITLAESTTLASLTLVGRGSCCSYRDVYNVQLLNDSGQVIGRYESLNANNASHSVTVALEADDNSIASTDGSWGNVIDWPLVAVSMANLPDGRILTFSGSERRTWPTTEQTYSAIWDPQTGNFDEQLHIGHNMFCGATSMTDEGELFVNGGRNSGNSPWTSIFNYQSSSWKQIQNMPSGGRWYPTTLALGNGDILTAMGNSSNVRNPEVWNADNGWRILNGIDFLSMRQNNNRLNIFPLLSQAPSGEIYHFWDTEENHLLSTEGNGSVQTANASTDHADHTGGVQVMYDIGKLLISGQNDGSPGGEAAAVTNNAFTIDLNESVPQIRESGLMTSARKFHQMIPLPTGEVLVVGGNTTGAKFVDSGSVLHAEIWNPQTRQFRRVASMDIPRDYHSTALLMTDGRVITAGGGYHGGNANSSGTHQDAQIYSPPYLFTADGQLAARPTLSVAEKTVTHHQQFQVNAGGNISHFSLIKMSSTTHALNTDVRQFRPTFVANGGGRYTLTMHWNANVATPGYWMLFAVDKNNVPSIAEIIKVRNTTDEIDGGTAPIINPVITQAVQTDRDTSFTAVATGAGLTYSWNFGDGSGDTPFSFNNNASHTYQSPGRYSVTVTVRNPSGAESTETFTQLVHRPLTSERAVASSGMVEIPDRNELYIVNPDNDSVAVINTQTRARVAIISVGEEPRSLAMAPDGTVWVVNKKSSSVSIINPSSRNVVQTVSLDRNSEPHGIVMGNGSAYIALQAIATVVQINTSNGTEMRRAFAGETPRHLSLNAAANRLYVSAFITPALDNEHTASPVTNRGGQVRAFSTSASSLSLQRVINLAYSDREISEHSGPGMPNYIGPPVVSPDGTSLWIPSKQDNILGGTLRSGTDLDFDQTVRAITSMISLPAESEILANRVDHDNASIGSHGAFGPHGLMYFTTLEGNRQVAVIDTSTALEIARFDTGHAPQSVTVSADGKRLYVHNFMDRSVSIYDIGAMVERGELDASELNRVSTVANEKLTAQVKRGKQLFYDARDDRLSALDYMSCASCHNEGGHDGRTWDFTGVGEGLRNTITLRGAGGLRNGMLHWTANFDELQDFEDQIRNFAGGTGLMSNDRYYTGSRSTPLGDRKAGQSSDLDALAAYMTSLTEVPASPYRDGLLSSAAEGGKQLFADRGCASCHAGSRATDSSTQANLHNIGTLDSDSGSRLSGALLGLDTPTLVGLWNTAPYLHDGSAQTIKGAIEAHTFIGLADQELNQLAAYLTELAPADLAGNTKRVKTIQIRSAAGSSNIIQLAEVIATRASDNVDVATAAQGATATVVSTYGNIDRFGVQNAIDGDSTEGSDNRGNYYHSGSSAGQLVTITLANAEELSSVSFIGRADCCSGRDIYDVTLLDESGNIILSNTAASADNSAHTATIELDSPANAGSEVSQQVKTIQIRSAAGSSNIIQLAEVIATRASDNVDVATAAQGATATVVSTYSNLTSRFGVQKAIDGDTTAGSDQRQNYYHSTTSAGQLVTITLANAEKLSSVSLIGRADCCSGRDVYDVTLRDESGNVILNNTAASANNSEHRATVALDNGVDRTTNELVSTLEIRSATESGSEIIQLTEVIATRATDNLDVALAANGARATATSAYLNNTATWGTQHAIDGAASTSPQGGFYHSALDANQLVTITLSQPTDLSSVTLVGRGNCCSSRDRYQLTLKNSIGDVIRRFDLVDAYNGARRATVNLDSNL